MNGRRIVSVVSVCAAIMAPVLSCAQDTDWLERVRIRSIEFEEQVRAEPFRGIVIDGEFADGLFPIRSTGVSTEPVRLAAESFLASLDDEQRSKTLFPVDDPEWRMWKNQHSYIRQGVSFKNMSDAQREKAFELMRASLSAKGMQLTRDIMRLNHTLAEMKNDNFVEYGEGLYSITIMGEPSADEPWGWQFDGHHAIVNYFVLGDQVVMSPAFFGSEPIRAESGKFEGVEILQEEQDMGLAFMRSLQGDQQQLALLGANKEGNNNVGEAFRDNIDLEFVGIPGRDLNQSQRADLLELIQLYVGNMSDGHAAVKMSEVASHIENTWFAWIGGTEDDSVYYYRILSPVILIEFDHQRPVALRHLYPRGPNRDHVHTVVRTPNGNDYGKDLLRQHYEQHAH